ncbi:hypothetical protein [Streptomyces sp. NPDC056672]|uniref:hypothetical protein n=1 Tax=Streptomyces sp. NPDC056672 TaxID=3345906 RepID=UPI0036C95A27
MSEGETIECRATRRGRTWVVSVPEHGVYGHGRTLEATRENTTQGLALAGVTADVIITPVTPELEKLRSAEDAYKAALTEAVAALALRRTTQGDIALATATSTRQVKLLLAEAKRTSPPADTTPVEEPQ